MSTEQPMRCMIGRDLDKPDRQPWRQARIHPDTARPATLVTQVGSYSDSGRTTFGQIVGVKQADQAWRLYAGRLLLGIVAGQSATSAYFPSTVVPAAYEHVPNGSRSTSTRLPVRDDPIAQYLSRWLPVCRVEMILDRTAIRPTAMHRSSAGSDSADCSTSTMSRG